MLDINDFIIEKGGDPKKIKESQRRRYASEEVVDEVIALYEDHRKSRLMEPKYWCRENWLTPYAAQYAATQIGSKINDVKKQIGVKKKAKENADELMKQKIDLEKEKKAIDESVAEKEVALKKKASTVGNIVHDSVPINNNEVRLCTKRLAQGLTQV